MSESFQGYSNEKKWETINRIMKDAVDCHVNMGQDYTGYAGGPIDRPFDDISIAKRASMEGMKTIVFTCHVAPAYFRIPLIQKAVDEWAESCGIRPVKLVGSVTLNYAMGALNPEVVRMMVRFGGKVVLMPTVDGAHSRNVRKLMGGIELVKNGKILPPLEEIFGIMADNSLVMDISHVEAQQRFILLDEGKEAGVKGFYVFNPGSSGIIGATDEQWVELAKKGLKLMPNANVVTIGESFTQKYNLMKKVGVQSLLSGTDLNNWQWQPGLHPVDGLRGFEALLLLQGMAESDVEKMYKSNPAKLLDL